MRNFFATGVIFPGKEEVATAPYPGGMYYVVLRTEKGILARKLLVLE